LENYKNFDSKFRYVNICAKRAKQILKGSKVLVDLKAENPLTLALAELEQGLVTPENINDLGKEKDIFSNIGVDDNPEETEFADAETDENISEETVKEPEEDSSQE
jgi:DNA-directed RNA polymerase omega subunit